MVTKTDNQSVGWTKKQWTVEDDEVTQDVSSRTQKSWVDTRTGSDLPNWRWRIKHGLNATSSYSCSFRTYSPISISAVATVTEPSGYTQRNINGPLANDWGDASDPSIISTASADQSARLEFINKYRSRRTAFQSGIFLGELAETVKMIRHPAQALRQGIDRYYSTVKKRLRRSNQKPRVIRDTWLEYQFGWKPFISDIEDACKIATAHPFRVFENISARGGNITDRSVTKNAAAYGFCRVLYTEVRQSTASVKIKGAIRAQNQPPGFPEQLGVSWSNVLPTIWELIPYSFLVDYFTNIGNVINGISTGTISLAWGCKNEFKICTHSIEGVRLDFDFLSGFGSSSASHSGNATGGGQAGSRTIYVRNPVTSISFGIGDSRFKLPGSDTKWLNIGALARLRR